MRRSGRLTIHSSWKPITLVLGLSGALALILRKRGGLMSASGEGAASAGLRQSAILKAQASIGTPYVWGGTKPDPGYDCSGFVQYIHGLIGIEIPRLVTEQASQAPRSINVQGKTETEMMTILIPGDCIALDYDFQSRDDHVGFYIGNGRIIHASGGQDCPTPSMRCKVVEDPLSRWVGKWETVFSWYGA